MSICTRNRRKTPHPGAGLRPEPVGQVLVLQANKGGFPGGSMLKNPPAIQEARFLSLSQEDPLQKGMATHSSVLACTEESGGLWSMALQRSDTTE